MTLTRPLPANCRRRARGRLWLLGSAQVIVLGLAAAGAVAAQQQPSVEVNLHAVDVLGPGKPVPPSDRISLHPPKQMMEQAEQTEAGEAEKSATQEKPARVAKPETAEKAPAMAPQGETKSGAVAQGEPASGTKAEGGSGEKAASSAAEAAAETPTQSAARTPASEPVPGPTRIVFADDSAELPSDAKEKLAPIIARMKKDPDLRVELRGYAPGSGPADRQARRLSLSRTLAVRLYLTEQGIGGTRALVRALGSKTEEKPIDRVDVVVVK